MSNNESEIIIARAWAEFRFAVVGRLFSDPPARGELQSELENLAKKTWKHPTTGARRRFAFSTIEVWYYTVKREKESSVEALKRKVRSDYGQFRSLTTEIKESCIQQYKDHPSWSYTLHADNLKAAHNDTPSRSSIRRFMKANGLFKRKKKKNKRINQIIAENRFEEREVRSFETEYVFGLWHLDFHICSRQVVTKSGQWVTPIVVAILDDHSRLACHLQWYLSEDTEVLVHSFIQALLKRGLPRALLSDNGRPMTSSEFKSGLKRLGIEPDTTLPYCPNQNGKQERFFSGLEGRLMSLLENNKELTLEELNHFTIAWMEMEYNRSIHSETKQRPIDRFANNKSVGRESPSYQQLKEMFCRERTRTQRRTDGTVSLNGIRYEIPDTYRFLDKIKVCYAQWDSSLVYIIDSKTGKKLADIYPVDKVKNANQKRRLRGEKSVIKVSESPSNEVPALLKKYMEQYQESGLPMAYLPYDEEEIKHDD
jgi:putative transposase